jgi:uncharacterized membrane protein YdjX (TVP38/TMEM64 family)
MKSEEKTRPVMKYLAINVGFFIVLVLFVFLILVHPSQIQTISRALIFLRPAQSFATEHVILTVILFCCAHLLSSIFSFPGSCTFLNILAGALFGFWMGCAIVYPVTILSAVLVYFGAAQLSSYGFVKRYEAKMLSLKGNLLNFDYIFLISLRLSPLLPFGVINLALGLLRIPFSTYFLTTAIGIFFDVTLLASIGAGLRATEAGSSHIEKSLAITFFMLFFVFLGLRTWLSRFQRQPDQTSRGRTVV